MLWCENTVKTKLNQLAQSENGFFRSDCKKAVGKDDCAFHWVIA
jgi:hypothetical protein